MTSGSKSESKGRSLRPRRWYWEATYADGLVLREDRPGAPGARYEDVRRPGMVRLALVSVRTGREVAAADLREGALVVRGKRIELRIGGAPVADSRGVTGAVQWKDGHAEWRPGRGSSGTVVDRHWVGFTAEGPDFVAAMVAGVEARAGRVEVRMEVQPRGGRPTFLPGDVVVLVDGEVFPWDTVVVR